MLAEARDEMRRLARDGWSAVADVYVEKLWNELDEKPYDRALLDRFASLADATKRVLDLGCGPGHVSKHLAARGLTMRGIDLAPEMVRVARERVPEATFEIGDLLALELEPRALGGAVLLYSLINLVREDVPVVLATVAAALAPNAPALIAVHRGRDVIQADEVLGKRVTMKATLFEPSEMARYARGAGLTVDFCATRPPYPTEYSSERVYVLARASS